MNFYVFLSIPFWVFYLKIECILFLGSLRYSSVIPRDDTDSCVCILRCMYVVTVLTFFTYGNFYIFLNSGAL